MKLTQFLDHAHDSSWWQPYARIIFCGSSMQPFFLQRLIVSLQHQQCLPHPLQLYPIAHHQEQTVIATLSQALLGSVVMYWLGDIDAKPSKKTTKKKQSLASFLQSYQGPHTIIFFAEQRPTRNDDNCLVIDCDEDITPTVLASIAKHLGYTMTPDKLRVVYSLIQEQKIQSYDTMCMLLDHCDLVSRKQLPLYKNYIGGLVDQRYSLSTLADYFFKQDRARFLTLWQQMRNDYSDMFWIMFWAEQVWRAYHVIYFMQHKNFRDAKRMSFRLPYAFTQTLWQKYDMKKLAQAYQYLYRCDYLLKRGEVVDPIESFLVTYFSSLS